MKPRTALILALLCPPLLPLPALAGLVLEQTTRGEGEAAQMMNGKSRISVSELGAMVEMLEMAENPMFKAGSYILMRPNDGQAMTVVNPSDKTYFRFDMGQMASMGSQMVGQQQQRMRESSHGDMSTKVSDPKVEKLLDEDGGSILGYPTRHYKFHIMYVTTQPMGPSQMDIMMDSTEELWTTEAVADPGAVKMLSGGGALPGSSELSKIAAVAEAARVPGVVLKRITISTSKVGGKGMGMGMMSKMMNKSANKPTKTTVEVTKLEKKDLPASTFRVPPGYTETDMFGGGAMPDLNDPGN